VDQGVEQEQVQVVALARVAQVVEHKDSVAEYAAVMAVVMPLVTLTHHVSLSHPRRPKEFTYTLNQTRRPKRLARSFYPGEDDMSGGKKKPASQKKSGKYTSQRVRTEANRLKKQKRHGERHPNDEQKKGVKTGRQLRSTIPVSKKGKGKSDKPEAVVSSEAAIAVDGAE